MQRSYFISHSPVSVVVCEPNPCENGGTCVKRGNATFICECPPPFQGLLCDTGLRENSVSLFLKPLIVPFYVLCFLSLSVPFDFKGLGLPDQP